MYQRVEDKQRLHQLWIILTGVSNIWPTGQVWLMEPLSPAHQDTSGPEILRVRSAAESSVLRTQKAGRRGLCRLSPRLPSSFLACSHLCSLPQQTAVMATVGTITAMPATTPVATAAATTVSATVVATTRGPTASRLVHKASWTLLT